MRAAVVTGDHDFEVEEVPDPAPGPGELLVRVEACGICGSDLKSIGHMPAGVVLGHEFCGEVVVWGGGVEGWRVGDRVAAMPLLACALAIELAAAQIIGFGVNGILERLDDGFALLSRRRAGGGHQHSLAETIEWSYQLLPPDERATFESLSVLSGSFDLDAALALTDGRASRREVEDRLATLVEKSMVVVVTEIDTDGRRYRLLDSLRDFGLRRVRERGDEHALRHRHLVHFGEVLAQIDDRLRGSDELAAHRAVLADWHHFRVAVDTACDRDDGVAASTLVRHVLWWALTRMRAEVGEWVERVRALPSVEALPERAVATAAAAYFAYLRRDMGSAQQLIAAAREEERRVGELPDPWVPTIEMFVSSDPLRHTAETQRRGRERGSLFWETVGILQEAVVRSTLVTYRAADARAARRTRRAHHCRDGDGGAPRQPERDRIRRTQPRRSAPEHRPGAAHRLLEHALATAEPLGLELLVGQIRSLIGVLLAGDGRPHDAMGVMATAIDSHLRAGAYSELAVDLAVCTRPLLDLGDDRLVRRVLTALGATHAIVDGEVDRSALGAGLFAWLAAAHTEPTPTAIDVLVGVARDVVEAGAVTSGS